MIYADNSATSYFKPECVYEAVKNIISNPGNPNRGSHENSLNASRILLDTRIKISDFFDCEDFQKVIFTSGITESLNLVINGTFNKGDHIITSYIEHNSVLRPLYRLGVDFSVTDGTVNEIKNNIKSNTKAVIINHVSNVTGEIQDIKSIGKLCREKNILFIVDTAQSAGVLPISMQENNIDILCFTGHKGLLGIQGIGGLCINGNIDIKPLKVGGNGFDSFNTQPPSQYPEKLEAGTLNMPGIASLNASIDFINSYGIDKIYQHEISLSNLFTEKISTVPKIKIYREADKNYLGVVSINIDGLDAGYVSDILSLKYAIHTRAGAHCAPLVHKHYNTQSMVRFSFGLNNSSADIDTIYNALLDIIKEN